MLKALAAMLVVAFVSTCAAAPVLAEPSTISVPDANKVIEATNFVVGRGCSGTLISTEHRLVLSNHHCITENITSVEQEVVGSDGIVRKIRLRRYTDVTVAQHARVGFALVGTASYVADVVLEDKNRDLALLRLRGPIPHTYASPLLPDGEAVVRGETVYIVGNPLGQDATLGVGIVSQLRRIVFPWANGAEIDVVQHSAGTIGGNSGGALYNARWQMIGVPAAGMTGAPHIGIAVAIGLVKTSLREACWSRAYDGLAGAARDAQCDLQRRRQAATEAGN